MAPRAPRMKNPFFERLKRLRWPGDRAKALRLEEELKARLSITPLKASPRLVAGVDAAFAGEMIVGAACLFTYPGLVKVAESHSVSKVPMPYVPGLLSFREAGALIEALEGLPDRPDLLICDGQGIAHPRGLGIASFLGAVLDIPSVGTAKSRLAGEHEEPGPEKGSRSPLVLDGRVVGAVVRTRDRTRPLFVSPGHGIDVEGAVEMTLGCATRFRITEPVRCADRLSKEVARRAREGRKRAPASSGGRGGTRL